MILIEQAAEHDELPIIRVVATLHFLRLAEAEAYRAGDPIPVSEDEAAAYLRQHSPYLWTFYSPEEMDRWAEQFAGPQAAALCQVSRLFLASFYLRPDSLEPVLYEAANG